MSPERFQRITEMLNHRQTDLTVCLEMVHKPHNLAAIVRTADAVGLDPAWISPEGGVRLRPDYWSEAGGMDGFYMARVQRKGKPSPA